MIRSSAVSDEARSLYTVPNPGYYSLIRAGKNPRWAKKEKSISCGGMLPFGALYWSMKSGTKIETEGELRGSLSYPDSVLELRDYQVEPMKVAEKIRGGLVVAPTGSGKSAMMAHLIKKIGHKTLVLVHSVDLLHQTAEEIEKFIGVVPAKFYGGEKKFGDITIATYHSAVKKRDLFEQQGFKMLIVDEADIFASDQYLDFLCMFPATRFYGFTATDRIEKYDDNLKRQIPFLQRIWGYKVVVKTEMQTEILKAIRFNEVYQKTYVDEYEIPIASKEWIMFRSALDVDMERQNKQIDWIRKYHLKGDYSIVLLDRVQDVIDYSVRLLDHLGGNVYMLHGEMSKKDRADMIENFKKTGGILVANIKIAGRGFNVVDANKSFICCPLRGETTLRQAVGRILRWMPDKESILHDWTDSSLASQKRKRLKVYREFYPDAEIINN